MQPVVGRGLWQGVNRHFELAGDQLLLELGRRRIGDLQRDPRMVNLDGDEIEHLVGHDRAHQAETQRRLLQPDEMLGVALGLIGLAVDLLEIGLDAAAELQRCVLARSR